MAQADVQVAIGPQPGHWRVREEGRLITWSNDECLCELTLTPEGLFFVGSNAPVGHPPLMNRTDNI